MTWWLLVLSGLSAILTRALLRSKSHRPPTSLEQDLAELGRRVEVFRVVVRDEVTPAIRRAAASFESFAEAYRRATR